MGETEWAGWVWTGRLVSCHSPWSKMKNVTWQFKEGPTEHVQNFSPVFGNAHQMTAETAFLTCGIGNGFWEMGSTQRCGDEHTALSAIRSWWTYRWGAAFLEMTLVVWTANFKIPRIFLVVCILIGDMYTDVSSFPHIYMIAENWKRPPWLE